MIEIKNLYSGYNGLEILKGVDINIKNKEIVALIGPNGAGKSTVIKSVFGFAKVTSGEIKFNKKNIIGLEPYELISQGICYINQGRIIFSNLTVRENLEIGAFGVKDRAKIRERLEKVYKKFPVLMERENSLAYALSGGQRQMLAIGRALMQSPKLLMMDEPSLGLSPILRIELFKMIRDLKKEGISVLLVEQNAKKAIQIADRTYLLEDGKIAIQGSGRFLSKHRKIKEVYLGGRY